MLISSSDGAPPVLSLLTTLSSSGYNQLFFGGGSWPSSNSGTGYGIALTRDVATSLTSTYIGKTNSSSFSYLISAGFRIWTKSISNSDDGQYVIAGAYNGLFLSSNYGSTFTQIT